MLPWDAGDAGKNGAQGRLTGGKKEAGPQNYPLADRVLIELREAERPPEGVSFYYPVISHDCTRRGSRADRTFAAVLDRLFECWIRGFDRLCIVACGGARGLLLFIVHSTT